MGRWSAWGFGMLAGAMMAYPAQAAEAARQGLTLWAQAVAPVLGPYMVCMLMVTSRLSLPAWAQVLLCWLCGSPGGARLMQGSGLRGRQALRFAAFTGTMSPLFFLSTVSGWLQNARGGRILLFCHLAGALLTGLCLGGGGKPRKRQPSPVPLGEALRESVLALCTVALCMMLGCTAARMASCAFPALPAAAAAALQCALEVTSGVRAVIALESHFREALVCAACSFGGLSLLMQNAAFWQDSGVRMRQLFWLRLLHALLSGGLCLLIRGTLTGVLY